MSASSHTAGDQPREDPALAVAEMRLAVALEDLGDAEPAGLLDLGVRVDEGQAEAGAEPPPDGRLADPHQPDQDDGALALERRAARLGSGGRAAGHLALEVFGIALHRAARYTPVRASAKCGRV
jgi:hypothetical protein